MPTSAAIAVPSTWLQCAITDCAPLRLGVTVNYIFFVLGLVVLAICSIAWTPRDEIWAKLAKEAKLQVHGFGYTSFLIAGCAFFGAVTLTYQSMENHWIFLVIWIVLFFAILLLEMVAGKLSAKPVEKMRPVQYFAWVTSLIANYWIWIGAANTMTRGA